MKNILMSFAAMLSLVSCTNIPYIAQSPPPTGIRYDPNVFVAGIATMSDAELARQKDLANAGDQRAAFNVYTHYRSAVNDQVKAMQWLTFTAELGHAAAQYNLAQIAIHNSDTPTAVYWAKRAKDSGYPNAASLLDSLKNP